MQFGAFTIDVALIIAFLEQSTAFEIVIRVFAIGGWLVLVYLLFYAGINLYAKLRENKFMHDWKYVVLAIDIPQLNVQTPKAVEQMFAHLAGSLNNPDLREKFRDGFKQRCFSFEIVSIGGYIQFIVWTEVAFRDLIETTIYAQYPEAEIVEIEDYVSTVPDSFPNDDYDIWAADFALAENDAFPIRSYREFEHNISKDTVLKDPMGTLLESFTRIGHGEQMWLQIIVEPVNNHWKEKAIKQVKELIGEEEKHGKGIMGHILDNPLMNELKKGLSEVNAQILSGGNFEAEEAHEVKKDPNKLRYMTPGQVKVVELMEEKMAKIGFKTKIRGIYIGRKEVFSPTRGVNALIGAINQFNIPSANSIVKKVHTGLRNVVKANRRKSVLMKAYKKRKIKIGANPYVLNIEELATIWHFPMSHVKTPMIQKAAVKSAEPPAGLPVEAIYDAPTFAPTEEVDTAPKFKTDTGEEIEFEKFG
ncbi:MAG: hypothetical protein WCW16_00420 [Candidatus Magasanikbacteria bacterium]